jgi:hypothetical protein
MSEGTTHQNEQRVRKLGFFAMLDRAFNVFIAVLVSIPIIGFTLIWIVLSFVIAYLGFEAIFTT